ncbi:MAG: ATP-binding protein [Cyanobacteria bacterium J06634_6]
MKEESTIIHPPDRPTQTPEETVQTLLRENRILKKKLARSERTHAEMEISNQRNERMLRQSLKDAEAYSAKLAEAQTELVRLNHQLEDRIEEESAALSKATDNLQQAQVQVANSEKFSTLGELVAGVAHEINNPISCITNNIRFIKEYQQQLIEHIALQQSVLLASDSTIRPSALEKVEDNAEDIDLEYIEEDFPKLVESMVTSGSRITEISQSLRTFARADTAHKQTYDLHKGLDGTLLILRHRLKAVGSRPAITVHKNYAALPEIRCYPGQINQVFMNIIANAIDATEEGEPPSGPPEIKIETKAAADSVIIVITDNAGGMPESVRNRIFESQFTTKNAEKGTGLGLSIAHQIITDSHRGEVACESKVGVGTTFRIVLPKR